MSLQVNWSDRLEGLAEGLFAAWDAATGGDPFARMCVVVGDMATRNWLQNYFLLQRKGGRRQVLANIDFVLMPEFVNDWLGAVTRGVRKEERRPSEHPYSQNVMTWRIDALLRKHADDPKLKPLADYIGTDERTRTQRRFALSARIAQLYDDYLASRYEMLVDWELGKEPEGEYVWQGVLYRMLVQECPATYTADYAAVLSGKVSPEKAFGFGFPHYASIHVFDVASASKPYFAFIEKMAETTPVTFWQFNPYAGDWKSANGKDRILLAALASGARAVLDEECRMAARPGIPRAKRAPKEALCGVSAPYQNGVGWIGSKEPFGTFKDLAIETRVCHSPRRELEALRNALHQFFATHADARPRDALVLCADWGSYAPLAEAVFGAPGDEGYIPIALEGALTEESPIVHAFQGLVAFKDNRFTVNEVFDLLSVPALRRKFGIDADGVAVLRELVREANIHWGYDDADARAILKIAAKDDVEDPRPYTWRRGLDRLELDALMGERPDADALEEAGEIGRIRPCGHVESDRAALVGNLARFVECLHKLRADLAGEKPSVGWRGRLLQIVEEFFDPDEEELSETSDIRRTILGAIGDLRRAWQYAGRDDGTIEGDVVLSAVLSGLGGRLPRFHATGDAVRIVPLKSASATPARFVWICGLNDGTFPRDGTRPALDLIGKDPKPFDITPRERDTFALLKASFGARERLAFSYIGRDVRSNDKVPAAVPLIDLLEWLGPDRVTTYEHPLQSFSPRYFLPAENGKPLPPNYSQADHDAAERLMKRTAAADTEVGPAKNICAFTFAESGETQVDLDEIVSFLQRPSTFLLRSRLQTWQNKPDNDQLSDDEAVSAELSWGQKIALKCAVDLSGIVNPESMVETGDAPTVASVEEQVDGVLSADEVDKLHCRTFKFTDPPDDYASESLSALEVLRTVASTEPTVVNWCATCQKHAVRTVGGLRLAVTNAGLHAVVYSEFKDSPYEECATLVRHIAGHAAGLSFTSVIIQGNGTLKALYPMARKDAEKRWREILEISFSPLPDSLPNENVSWKDDNLPEELRARLWGEIAFDKSARLVRRAR